MGDRKKGLSPVIATVILLACALTIAVAVAWWATEKFYVEEPIWEAPEFTSNAIIVVDVEGNVWAVYENGTHIFYAKLVDFDEWTIETVTK